MEKSFFLKARPVFPAGKSTEMNTYAVFRMCSDTLAGMTLHVAAATFYRIFVNGSFVAFGPARTAFGYARVDEIALNRYDNAGQNEIIIEVAGYCCHAISTVFQPSFLCAELRRGTEVAAATGPETAAYLPACRWQKVKRFSFQRHFSEIWDFRKEAVLGGLAPVACEVLDLPLRFLARRAPYPQYRRIDTTAVRTQGTLAFDETLPARTTPYSIYPMPDFWGTFDDGEIPAFPYLWVQKQRQTPTGADVSMPLYLRENEYVIIDLSRIECGFLHLSALAKEESDVVLAFSEVGDGKTFTFPNMNAQPVIELFLPEGDDRRFMSFEPYTFKYIAVMVKRGCITLKQVGYTAYEYDISGVSVPDCKDETLNSVYRGALATFAHNAVDIYMDCPSRERAGWLCDSYFTAQTEYALFGKVPVEEDYLENFSLFTPDEHNPEGMFPMCYPADTHFNPDGTVRFIPQWSMWYIIEVADHVKKRAPYADREKFREGIDGLMAFFKKYENEDGLLERLPSWNFVEWSDAGKWTWDVNYPTNFLYAKVLESYYRIYGEEWALTRAKEVQAATVKQSFNGQYFADHALRNEKGELVVQPESSEACQYYAILFGGIDIHAAKYRALYRLVTEVFGATRSTPMPEILEVNAFIGAYLRLEALLKMKEHELVLRDVAGFFGEMEKESGTLWEYRQGKGSRDHGFASFALVAIRKALGLD